MFIARPVILVMATAFLASAALAQDSPEDLAKREDIRRLIEMSGEAQAMQQVMLATIDQLRIANTGLPDQFFEEFKNAAMSGELPALMVPVYERHFTHEEIRDLIAFFQSPLGQALVRKQPLIRQDAMGVGQAWGAKTAKTITERLQAKGLLPAEAPAVGQDQE
jgi:hypothetical protein